MARLMDKGAQGGKKAPPLQSPGYSPRVTAAAKKMGELMQSKVQKPASRRKTSTGK